MRFSGAFCFVLFVLAASVGLVMGGQQRASLGWPTVTGRFEKLETATKYIPTRYGSVRREFPIVHYTYTVQGKNYQSNKVSLLHADELPHLLSTHFDFQSETWTSTDWVKGGEITVHFDPKNPGESLTCSPYSDPLWV